MYGRRSDGGEMDFNEVRKAALTFRKEREWEQFHNPKDLAISIGLEAAELLEVFQWSGAETDKPSKRTAMEEELADILIYCTYMAEDLGIDLLEAASRKIARNAEKYPVEKARGTSRKYTDL